MQNFVKNLHGSHSRFHVLSIYILKQILMSQYDRILKIYEHLKYQHY
jgi:hypothetical protein